MVKILSLIGSLLVAAGTGLMALALATLTSGGVSIEVFFESASFSNMDIPGIAQILVYVGMILVVLSGFFKGNKMLVISGILTILALLGCLMGWLANDSFESNIYGITPYFFGSMFLVIAWLLYFIGCIGFRSKNKIAWLTALLVFLGIIVVNVYFGFIFISSNFNDEGITLHLISLTILYGLFFVHGLVFTFSKKKSWLDGEGGSRDDAYSVSGGSAFASYVPEDDAYALGGSTGKKKKKKKKGGDDFDFNF